MSEITNAERLDRLERIRDLIARLRVCDEPGCTNCLCEEAAAELEAQERILDAVRKLHAPHGIYDDCGHEHEAAGLYGAVEIPDIGLTCLKLYDICLSCCDVSDDGSQSEECASGHDHGRNKPICPTRAILDGEKP